MHCCLYLARGGGVQIRGEDSGKLRQLNGSVRVIFTVVDRPAASPHAPVFSRTQAAYEVLEDLAVGRPILTPQASDEDGDTLWYSIISELFLARKW